MSAVFAHDKSHIVTLSCDITYNILISLWETAADRYFSLKKKLENVPFSYFVLPNLSNLPKSRNNFLNKMKVHYKIVYIHTCSKWYMWVFLMRIEQHLSFRAYNEKNVPSFYTIILSFHFKLKCKKKSDFSFQMTVYWNIVRLVILVFFNVIKCLKGFILISEKIQNTSYSLKKKPGTFYQFILFAWSRDI